VTRLAELEARISGMEDLHDIVGAMRSLAGMRLIEAQRALPGIRRYADILAAAIGTSLALLPEMRPGAATSGGKRALILCGSEHGFVGAFNEKLLDEAQGLIRPEDLLFLLGSRATVLAEDRGWVATWSGRMATRSASAPDMVRALSGELYRRIALGQLSRIEILYARHQPGGVARIEHRLLLPLDLTPLAAAPRRQTPLHYLPAGLLCEKLMTDYIFALLGEAVIESVASENGARLAAMESAHENLQKKLAQLRLVAAQTRQNDITTELIDLITGAEAQETGFRL
jgi:F-type H+-transporting ATPase subunit gamma